MKRLLGIIAESAVVLSLTVSMFAVSAAVPDTADAICCSGGIKNAHCCDNELDWYCKDACGS